MIVHRLGRTILLDEFDVHSHLLRLEKVINDIIFEIILFYFVRMNGLGFEIFFLIRFYVIYLLNIFIKKIKHVMNLYEKIVWLNFYVKGRISYINFLID
jgi:hypothetical protein